MVESNNWHLSKSVPLGLIFAIFMQTVALIWFVAGLDNGIENNAREIARNDARIATIENVVQSQAVTLARIDENLREIRDFIERATR